MTEEDKKAFKESTHCHMYNVKKDSIGSLSKIILSKIMIIF